MKREIYTYLLLIMRTLHLNVLFLILGIKTNGHVSRDISYQQNKKIT